MEEQLNEMISSHAILVVGNSNELETQLSTDIIKNAGASYHLHDLNSEANKEGWMTAIDNCLGTNKLPLIFIAGDLLGGYFELKEADKNDELIPRLCSFGIPNNAMPEGDVDLLVGEPEYGGNDEDDGGMGDLFG